MKKIKGVGDKKKRNIDFQCFSCVFCSGLPFTSFALGLFYLGGGAGAQTWPCTWASFRESFASVLLLICLLGRSREKEGHIWKVDWGSCKPHKSSVGSKGRFGALSKLLFHSRVSSRQDLHSELADTSDSLCWYSKARIRAQPYLDSYSKSEFWAASLQFLTHDPVLRK